MMAVVVVVVVVVAVVAEAEKERAVVVRRNVEEDGGRGRRAWRWRQIIRTRVDVDRAGNNFAHNYRGAADGAGARYGAVAGV